MTTYKYKAISNSGVEITGVIKARDRSDAVIQLKDKCSIISSLTEVSDVAAFLEKVEIVQFSEKNLALVCKQFSIILSAGLPIVRTVELVAGQMEDRSLRKMLYQVADDVSSGYGLASSFAQRGPQLPVIFIETVRAGEESGALEETFEKLSEYFTKKAKTKGKVISALTYPAFVIGVAIVVIAIIMIYAVPTFSASFASMGMELPLPTRMLIGMSEFIKKYILLILAVLALIIVAIRVYGHTENGRIELAKINLHLPILGKIQLMNASSQFANTMSTMISSGIPVIRALSITGNAMSNAYMGKSVKEIVEGVESGYRIGNCMKSAGKFPELLSEMTSVGEESGSMEETLRVIGEYYDNEVETTTTRAMGLLEPIIICILAVFVVLVLLAVYLPMFNMYGSIA